MDNAKLIELQGQSVGKITEQLSALGRESLVELQALETNAEAPRSTLLTAIDGALKAMDDAENDGPQKNQPNPSAVGDVAGKPAAKAAGKLAATHWQHPDYAGPLNGEQAAWRVANIKPVQAVRTK